MNAANDLLVHTGLFNGFTAVSTIGIQRLVSIFPFIQEFLYYFTVMHIGSSNLISSDEFCFTIRFYMVLISKVAFAIVLYPLSIRVLLPELIVLPLFRHIAFLECLILFPAIALNGYFYNRGIHQLAFVHDN